MAIVPIDVRNALAKQAPRFLRRQFKKETTNKFNKIKSEMIEEFLAHPVTVEIRSGPNGSNISGTLGGASNLFAFIGFRSGTDPIEPILQILQSTNISFKRELKSPFAIGVEYNVFLPEAKDIFDVTPFPFVKGDRSWAEGIERGISGLGYLLRRKTRASRSGVALQGRKKTRSGKFSNTKYISALIKKYKKRFKQLK